VNHLSTVCSSGRERTISVPRRVSMKGRIQLSLARWHNVGTAILVASVLAACGGGGGSTGGGGGAGGGGSTPPPTSYTVGGTLSGLAGTGLVLQNNGGNDLALSANGTFSFTPSVASGAPYSVSVKTQPSNPAQNCVVENATGTTGSANVTAISVKCTTDPVLYALGGTLSGLKGSGLVLQNKGGDGLTLAANGTFNFNTKLASGTAYDITVKTQPTAPAQTCTVANGAGTVATVAVTGIVVSCGPIALLSGALGGKGNRDDVGSDARFNGPIGLAVDRNGNVYVTDYNNETIRKITPGGEVKTVAGTGVFGSADGIRTGASFGYPLGIAIGGAGNVYVADSGNGTVRMITADSMVSTLAGSAGQLAYVDAKGNNARFDHPWGLAADGAGNVYVADAKENVIRKITPQGDVTTVAGDKTGVAGSKDGAGGVAQFNNPSGVAIDGQDILYVADTGNNTIRKITPNGNDVNVSTLAGTARPDGGFADDPSGTGAAARFSAPYSVAVDATGNLYVADARNNVIRKITPNKVVTTLAGTAGTPGDIDGAGAAARFSVPSGVATDTGGNVYVADNLNNSIRKITPAGAVTTLAGLTAQSGSVNGIGGAARFNNPTGLAVDAAGTVYVADTGNQTIRKVAAGAVVTTLAGVGGMSGYSDTAPALFASPAGLATDAAVNVYVGDAVNSAVRKISPTGTVSTPAKGLPIMSPNGVAIDAGGNVYVADPRGNSILKVANGFVSTFAGTGHAGSDNGDRKTATFGNPQVIAIDTAGTLYVADTGNNMIRKIATDGTVSTLAGAMVVGGFKDAKIGTDARFNYPVGLVIDSAGNLYVADQGNSVIRKINTTTTEVTTVVGAPGFAGVKLGVLPGGLNLPSYLALMPGSGTTLLVTDENAVLQIELP
jgi:hypothetical protein